MRLQWALLFSGVCVAGAGLGLGIACGSGMGSTATPTTQPTNPADAMTVGASETGAPSPGEAGTLDGAPVDTGPPLLPDSGAIPASVSVVQYHNHLWRDGLYADPLLKKSSIATMHVDTTFVAKVTGPTYAQPLYIEEGPGGQEIVLVATEQNVVTAFRSTGASIAWQSAPVGKPVPLSKMPCGNIDPIGITGTPFVDVASRTIYLAAMVTPDDGTTKKHQIFALSLDDGSKRAGWPVDVETALATAAPPFASTAQSQRGALALVDGVLYVPYGGLDGDCGNYHGWVVGVDVTTGAPGRVQSWSTPAVNGGIWAVGGVASDGVNLFATTGNTNGASASQWGGGEAVLRFTKGPVFSNKTADYFAPTNWLALDEADLDLGGAAAMLVDVPGATPSTLVMAMGKDGKAYLMDRTTLGGIGNQITSLAVANNQINAAGATITTANGTFISFRVTGGGSGTVCPAGGSGNLVTVKITKTSPPTIVPVWCSVENDLSSPIATTTGNGADAMFWAVSSDRLYGYDAETGAELFKGGGAGDQMTTIQYFQTPIVARGRIFVPAMNQLYAFGL